MANHLADGSHPATKVSDKTYRGHPPQRLNAAKLRRCSEITLVIDR